MLNITYVANPCLIILGVYGTTMPPSSSDESILSNNYDGNTQKESDPKNVECYVKVCMPKDEMHPVNTLDGRDVLVHRGDINLSDRHHEIVCTKK